MDLLVSSGDLRVVGGAEVNGLQVNGNTTLLGSLDAQIYIQNTSANYGGAVEINDQLLVVGSADFQSPLSNTGSANGGFVVVSDDFRVTGLFDITGNVDFGTNATNTITFKGHVDSHIIPFSDATYDLGTSSSSWANVYTYNLYSRGGLHDGVSFGANGQVPIANGSGNWAWQDVAGSFAIATDNKTITGNGTLANPIKVNNVITTSSTATWDLDATNSNVFNYTGDGATLVVSGATTGRVVYVMKTAGSGNLSFGGKQIGLNQAMSFIYTGTQWIVIASN
jgi:hypothetical protein